MLPVAHKSRCGNESAKECFGCVTVYMDLTTLSHRVHSSDFFAFWLHESTSKYLLP